MNINRRILSAFRMNNNGKCKKKKEKNRENCFLITELKRWNWCSFPEQTNKSLSMSTIESSTLSRMASSIKSHIQICIYKQWHCAIQRRCLVSQYHSNCSNWECCGLEAAGGFLLLIKALFFRLSEILNIDACHQFEQLKKKIWATMSCHFAMCEFSDSQLCEIL